MKLTNVATWGKYSFLVILLPLALGLLVFYYQSSPVVRIAPNSIFTTLTGATVTLKELQGKPVVVTFWATDCAVCIKEIPYLAKLYQQFHPQGLEIIAIAMYYDPPNRVKFMSQAKQIPYPVVLDISAKHAQAFGNIRLTPTTFLISPSGTIALKKVGLLDEIELQQRIENFL